MTKIHNFIKPEVKDAYGISTYLFNNVSILGSSYPYIPKYDKDKNPGLELFEKQLKITVRFPNGNIITLPFKQKRYHYTVQEMGVKNNVWYDEYYVEVLYNEALAKISLDKVEVDFNDILKINEIQQRLIDKYKKFNEERNKR